MLPIVTMFIWPLLVIWKLTKMILKYCWFGVLAVTVISGITGGPLPLNQFQAIMIICIPFTLFFNYVIGKRLREQA